MPTTFSFALIAIALTGVAAPMLAYATVGWRAKRNDVLDSLTPEARFAYFRMFCRGSSRPADAQAAVQAFETMYGRWYGRRFYLLPCVLLLLAATAAITSVVTTSLGAVGYTADHSLLQLPRLPDAAVAALAGAYLWVVDDLIGRARRLDFAPSDALWGTLRFVISIPMGYAFMAIAATGLATFIAFALGAFPLSSLIAILRRIGENKLGLGETGDAAADEIVKLQGMNREIVERLRNEDITTVTQMAYCDPVRLVMRSNLSFNFVADCMSQALAWI